FPVERVSRAREGVAGGRWVSMGVEGVAGVVEGAQAVYPIYKTVDVKSNRNNEHNKLELALVLKQGPHDRPTRSLATDWLTGRLADWQEQSASWRRRPGEWSRRERKESLANYSQPAAKTASILRGRAYHSHYTDKLHSPHNTWRWAVVGGGARWRDGSAPRCE
ncbi:unnamed protein product, partial [Danaus chrysippus]